MAEELDLSYLTERLMQGKGRQPSSLSSKEKLELWESLKILCFTRMALSLWAMTILSLYVRVQLNILGRHFYIDTARGLASSQVLDEDVLFDRHGQQEFLGTADYLSNYAMSSLIPNMQTAATEVLKDQQLRDPFDMARLHDTMQILKAFMSWGAHISGWHTCYLKMPSSKSSWLACPLVILTVLIRFQTLVSLSNSWRRPVLFQLGIVEAIVVNFTCLQLWYGKVQKQREHEL